MGEAPTGIRVSSTVDARFSAGKCLGSLCWNYYLDSVDDEIAILEQAILADIIQTRTPWRMVHYTD